MQSLKKSYDYQIIGRYLAMDRMSLIMFILYKDIYITISLLYRKLFMTFKLRILKHFYWQFINFVFFPLRVLVQAVSALVYSLL